MTRMKLIANEILTPSFVETDELLQTTNLHNSKTNHFDSMNCRKSLVINGSANNNSLADDKQTVQSGETSANHGLRVELLSLIAAKESLLADNAINKLFEEYKDKNEEGSILSEGVEKLCQDLNYSPDEFPILVLAFCLDAKQMCCFTKKEFIHGLKKLNATTINELRQRLKQIVESLETDMDLFKHLYRFTFHFGLDDGTRILGIDMAMSLWRLVYSIHKPPDNVLERWLNFLVKENIRGIQRDTWMMFQNFSESFDINSYDSDEAW